MIKHPNFFIIGAAKSGTSSLYKYLDQHPQIYMSPVKEPHYFSYREKYLFSKGPNDLKRMEGATSDLNSYLLLFKHAANEKCIGEASTTYLDSLDAPHAIKSFVPQAKIIVILRNPVDRAYASFMHLRRDGVENYSDFGKALEAEEIRIMNQWSILWHYKSRQFTYEKLARYYSIFPKAQIKVYEYERWKQNNGIILRDIWSFLEVDQIVSINVSIKYNVGGTPRSELIHNFLSKKSSCKEIFKLLIPYPYRILLRKRIFKLNLIKPMLSRELRSKLLNAYREDIEKLQELTQLDLSLWLNEKDSTNPTQIKI